MFVHFSLQKKGDVWKDASCQDDGMGIQKGLRVNNKLFYVSLSEDGRSITVKELSPEMLNDPMRALFAYNLQLNMLDPSKTEEAEMISAITARIHALSD